MMACYDRSAKKRYSVAGAQGGALKKLVLNDFVLGKLPCIVRLAILNRPVTFVFGGAGGSDASRTRDPS